MIRTLVAVTAAVSLFGGLTTPVHANNPIMHNSSSTSSTYWGGGWGNNPNSKYGQFTCTTCHTAGLTTGNAKQIKSTIVSPKAGDPFPGGSTVIFNTWSSFGYRSPRPVTKSMRVCEVCHSKTLHHRYSTALGDVTLKHSGGDDAGSANYDCTVCHKHSNGFKKGGSCTSCHGDPPANATQLVSPYDGATGTTGSAGAHSTHETRFPGNGINECTICHNGNSMPNTTGKIYMGFRAYTGRTGGLMASGTFTGYTTLTGEVFASGSAGTTAKRRSTNYNICSVYCHGGGTTTSGGIVKAPLTGGSVAFPQWTSSSHAAKACGACHGTTSASPPNMGTHKKHAGTYAVSCSKCHGSVTNNTHIRGNVFWKLSTGSALIGASATYAGQAHYSTNALAPSASYGSCNNIYCHSNGRATPTYNQPTWGGALVSNCVRCHGNSNATQRPMSSNAHRAHVNNTAARFNGMSFNCEECHAATLSATFINNTSIATRSNHVNGVKDVVWGAMNSAPVTGTTAYTPGSTCASTSQSQIYCHSNGTSTTVGTVQTAPNQAPVGAGGWTTVTDGQQGTKDCGMCHGGAVGDSFVIASNRHTQHVAANSGITHTALTCNLCHGRTVNATGAALITNGTGLHLSRTIDVRLSTKSGAFGNRSGAFVSFATAQCTNTYCHGNNTTPAFTQTASALACNGCHEASKATFGLSSTHYKHYNTATVAANATAWTASKNSGDPVNGYVFSCGNCHSSNGTSHVNGPATGNSDAELAFNHMTSWTPTGFTNGNVVRGSVSSTDGRGYKYTKGTTCNVYCHSNGYTGNPKPRTQALQPGTVTCGKCHATSALKNYSGSTTNVDWSPGHKKHMMAAVNGGGTVTQNRYSSNSRFRCGACHIGTVANGTNITLIAGKDHLNGFVNVSSNNTVGTGAAPLKWSSASNTCTNSYCHSNGRAGVPQYATTPSWRTGAGTITCLSCHGGLNGTAYSASAAGFKLSTTHQRHLGLYPTVISCNMCHGKTAANSATLKQYTGVMRHANGTKDISLQYPVSGTTVAYTGYTATYRTGKTCGNVSCHGGVSRYAWSENGALRTDYTCVKCHGTAGTANGTNVKLFAPGWNKTGIDTDNKTSRNAVKAGAHFLHISSVFMRKMYCTECHNALPATAFASGHINQQRYGLNTGVLNFANSTTALYSGAAQGSAPTRISVFSGFTTAQNSGKAATCSSVYCHGSRLHSGNTEGTYRAPYWNYSGLINPTPSVTTCSRCHGLPPSNVSSHSGLSSANFPSGCNCHSQIISLSTGAIINKSLHINGVANNSSVCTDCHGVAVTTDNIYNPRAVVPDFSLASRHVFSNTGTSGIRPISAFDCVVCHMEGDESKSDTSNATPTASPNATYHRVGTTINSRFVHLRNVQTVTGQFLWSRYSTSANAGDPSGQSLGQTQKYSNMDSFCMSCHSPKGATGIISYAATAGNPPTGTRATTQASGGPTAAQALNPWSENTGLTRASGPSSHLTRTRITNVFSQFSTMWKWPKGDGTKPAGFTTSNYAGNASHHAVRGPRYYGNNASWGTAAWTSNILKSRQNINSVRETAQLHCADCHSSDTNGHGSSTIFMLADKSTVSGFVVGISGDVSAVDKLCWGCHSGSVYNPSPVAGSRWSHAADGHALSTSYDAYVTGACRNCHGGGGGSDADGTVSTQYGAIHGMAGTGISTPAPGTVTRYRFIGGEYMTPAPAADSGWTTTGSNNCYTNSTGWSNCTHHSAGATGGGYSYSYGRPTSY
ncbi:MAG TPA: CxxxxCH/CxxCH domain-containing protein [Geobacteraceae bacterium]